MARPAAAATCLSSIAFASRSRNRGSSQCYNVLNSQDLDLELDVVIVDGASYLEPVLGDLDGDTDLDGLAVLGVVAFIHLMDVKVSGETHPRLKQHSSCQ